MFSSLNNFSLKPVTKAHFSALYDGIDASLLRIAPIMKARCVFTDHVFTHHAMWGRGAEFEQLRYTLHNSI